MTNSDDFYVTSISCGSSHSVALLNCDIVVSWGRGEDGQLGHGDANERLLPEAVCSLNRAGVENVYCGAEYTVALSSSQDRLYSWGWGDFGRLGHGDCRDIFLPEIITSLSSLSVSSVACGDTHTLVVTQMGGLYSFGRNQNGQLGLGTRDDALAPQHVEALQGHKVVSVSCGAEHSLAATDKGEVYAWGWGRYGNLGTGEVQDRLLPTRVESLAGVDIQKVACGWRHSIVVDTKGRLFTFGWSKYGQLGHGDNNDQLQPMQVAALADRRVTLAAGGWRHTVAVDEGGRLFSWGWNKFGQLGLGNNKDCNSPHPVAGALDGQQVSLLACGWRHTMAVSTSGQVYAWGRGVNGQLGVGEAVDRWTPQLVKHLSKGSIDLAVLQRPANTRAAGYVPTADRYAVVPDQQTANGSTSMSVPDVGSEPPAKKPKT